MTITAHSYMHVCYVTHNEGTFLLIGFQGHLWSFVGADGAQERETRPVLFSLTT